MTQTERIIIIRDFVPRLRKQVEGLSDHELTHPFVEGEWTIAQNVHHLLDAHINAYQLFKRVLTEENAQISWPDQDAIAELPDGKTANLEPSFIGLEGLHARWTDMLNHIDNWEKSGTSMSSGKVYSVDDLLRIYSNHCNNHIDQIQAVIDAIPPA